MAFWGASSSHLFDGRASGHERFRVRAVGHHARTPAPTTDASMKLAPR
jgi:hypothetical protein